MCCDPLDGSRNIDCNIPVGSIFGVYRVVPTLGTGEGDGVAQCTQPARSQLAAGYAHHSGATTLVLAVGDEGSAVEFVLDDDTGAFVVAADGAPLRCPPRGADLFPQRREVRRLAGGSAVLRHRRSTGRKSNRRAIQRQVRVLARG